MLVSELVAHTGVPLATVKYYLREGLLMPGEATSATRSVYGEEHVRRLGLIKELAGIGLSISRIKAIVALIDNPGPSLFEALGAAVSTLPPSPEPGRHRPGADVESSIDSTSVLRLLGWTGAVNWPAVRQLDQALAAASAAGMPMDAERLANYALHMRAIAEFDIDHMPRESASAAVEYAVLGTALYEPIIAALRRVAHAELAASLLEPEGKVPHVP